MAKTEVVLLHFEFFFVSVAVVSNGYRARFHQVQDVEFE